MKEMNILGLSLQDYTLREKMRLLDSHLDHGTLGTVGFVSARVLMQAEKDARQKEWLESMDILEYCDPDILRAAGITSGGRLKEIENGSFLKGLLQRLGERQRPVYLLADTPEAMLKLETGAAERRIRVAGRNLLQEEAEDYPDAVINDINDKAPGAILVLADCLVQADFISANRERINADFWVVLQGDAAAAGEPEKRIPGLIKTLRKKMFQRKVHQYENQEKTEQ